MVVLLMCSTYVRCSGRSLLLPSTPKEVGKRVMAATLLPSFCLLQPIMAKSIIGLPLLWVTQHCIGCSGRWKGDVWRVLVKPCLW